MTLCQKDERVLKLSLLASSFLGRICIHTYTRTHTHTHTHTPPHTHMSPGQDETRVCAGVYIYSKYLQEKTTICDS